MRGLLIAVIGLAACADEGEFIEYNTGRACAFSCIPGEADCWDSQLGSEPQGRQVFDSPSRIGFAVMISPAIGGCLMDVETSCSVTPTSYSRLTVSSELRGVPTNGPCAREAQFYYAYCAANIIANVPHRIEYGDLEMTLELPGDYAEPLCVQP